MNVIDQLISRNRAFAAQRFDATLKMLPKAKILVIGCIDPRVDPAEVLGLEPGEAAILRNIGGRVTPNVLLELELLRTVVKTSPAGDMANGWNVVVLHHTDCGIRKLDGVTQELARFLGAEPSELEERHVHDPRKAVARDIEALRADRAIAGELLVTGLVYDVASGMIETVVPTAPLRA